ncbi:MAG: hypothetical protein V1754_01800, partial [Pseudomonadota bacterium]
PETISLRKENSRVMLKLIKEGYKVGYVDLVPDQDHKINRRLKPIFQTPIDGHPRRAVHTTRPDVPIYPPTRAIVTPPPNTAPPVVDKPPPEKKQPLPKNNTPRIGGKVPELRDPFKDD